jgi:hypothetical protein
MLNNLMRSKLYAKFGVALVVFAMTGLPSLSFAESKLRQQIRRRRHGKGISGPAKNSPETGEGCAPICTSMVSTSVSGSRITGKEL